MEATKPSFLRETSNKIRDWNLFEWYYTLVMLGYVLTLFVDAMRPGVFAALLMLGVAAELVLKKRISFHHTLDWLVAVYFFYNLLSVIWLTKSGLPAKIYADEFASSVLPILFYMVGRTAKERTKDFYKKFLLALLLICVIGLLLYITAPQFYLDYLFKWSYISKADAPTMRIRMHSVIGSTILGFLAVSGMLAASYFLMENKERKMGILFLGLNFVFALLSNQRSAMVVAVLILIYVNQLVFFEFRLIKKKFFFIECAAILTAFLGLCLVSFEVVMKIYYRLVSLPGAIGQRSEQWVAAVNNMYSYWFGNGLGANGHKALDFEGTHVIADGGLIKMFCEEGILGFSIFLYILILIFTKSVRHLKDCYVELGVIAIALLQSIGSNIISFQLAAPIFWFAVGRCADVISSHAYGDTDGAGNDRKQE